MRVSDICGNKGVESQLLYRDAEFGQLSFVCFDHVGVGFSDLFKLCLDALDRLVFDVFDLVEGAADHAEFVGVDVGGGEDLVDACLLSI